MNATKHLIKSLALKALNALPVSSNLIGSPRKMVRASGLNFKDAESEYILVQKAKAIIEAPPGSVDKEVFFKYEDFFTRIEPEQFILKLKGGRVWGRNGAVITSDDIFVSDVSQEFGPAKVDISKHSIFRRLKLKKPIEINGVVAVIASPGGNVYAHWLCDIIPRLVLLKKQGILEKVDKIIMSFSWLDYQLETLERLGIDKTKIINSIDDTEFHLKAKTLFVPSYPNVHGTVNKWVCEEIKKVFLPKNYTSQKNGRLFISRAKAVGRNMVNEEEVFSFLKNEYGFIKIFAEEYSTADKAKLFNDAECIVGPHGGGFTNLLFCTQGCKVVDIFPPGDFTTYFWVLSNANSLEYSYFFGKGEMPTREKDVAERNAFIDVDLDNFKNLMDKLNLEKGNTK